ncbi:hypothetical protein KKE92_02330 [Candidatus Micrarchaeota archaeon]|nr:hypothetical protein [Candidatus Micrarchaeota archaeon]MBU1681872.1 hypothetical protein [Candidatus Micrarchaeota archaeon]
MDALNWRFPDRSSALRAIDLASAMLSHASSGLEEKKYLETFNHSRDAMRFAASAILLKDGKSADTIDETMLYLKKNYPHDIPVDAWRTIESQIIGSDPGLLNLIIRFIGKIKKTSAEDDAKYALNAAIDFLDNVKRMVEL